MAHNISAKQLQLLDLFSETDAVIKPFETRSREGDFMLTASNWRGETIAVQFSEADAYALQDWLNERFPKNVP